jgi:hypothetical protein
MTLAKGNKSPAFNPAYEEQYGLRVSARDPSTKMVVSVECRFCVAFGREHKVGAKRKVTNNIHFFTSFRADQIKSHLKDQHPDRWGEYEQCSSEGKKSFFDGVRPFKSTLHAHFGGSQNALNYSVNKVIVDVLIGEMLFDADGDEDVEGFRKRALASFIDLHTGCYGIKACSSDVCILYLNLNIKVF